LAQTSTSEATQQVQQQYDAYDQLAGQVQAANSAGPSEGNVGPLAPYSEQDLAAEYASIGRGEDAIAYNQGWSGQSPAASVLGAIFLPDQAGGWAQDNGFISGVHTAVTAASDFAAVAAPVFGFASSVIAAGDAEIAALGLADFAPEAGGSAGVDGAFGGEGQVPMVNGRFPQNARYAGQTYPLEKLSPELRAAYPNSVQFTPQGFPDFSPYAQAEVQITGLTGNYTIDSAVANKAVGLTVAPEDYGYVWHHVEDGITMQLVPSDIHTAVRHTGGAAIITGSR
jgi:hypothetical protein